MHILIALKNIFCFNKASWNEWLVKGLTLKEYNQIHSWKPEEKLLEWGEIHKIIKKQIHLCSTEKPQEHTLRTCTMMYHHSCTKPSLNSLIPLLWELFHDNTWISCYLLHILHCSFTILITDIYTIRSYIKDILSNCHQRTIKTLT